MRTFAASLLAAVLALGTGQAQADPVAEFYNGKQITLIVGYGPGGGYDIFGRIIAKYIGRHIPGNPTVVVQNMPGAGSLRAANFIYEAAPKDGTYIATFARDMPLLGILEHNDNVRFDPRKFTWLGSPSSYGNDSYILWARKDSRFKSIQDVMQPGEPKLVLGGTAEGATGNDVAIMMRDLLGLNVRLISGYTDSAALNLAIDRGELDGRFVGLSSLSSTKAEWLMPNGIVRALMQFARATRHPDYPDIPTARELAPNPKALALIEIAEMPYILSRPFVAPPGIPADRAKALQDAFVAANKDPEYIQEAKRLGIDISPIDGNAVREILDRISGAPPDLLDYLRNKQKGNEKGG